MKALLNTLGFGDIPYLLDFIDVTWHVALVLMLGWGLWAVCKRLIALLHERALERKASSDELKRIETMTQVFRYVAGVVIVVVTVMLLLGELGISIAPLLATAGIAGVAIGLAMATSVGANGFFGPLVSLTYSLPKAALVPLFILWFGVGTEMKVLFVAMIVFLLVFRNGTARLMAMIPSLFAILVMFGAMRLFGIPLNIATIIGMGWIQGLNLAPIAFIMTAAVFRAIERDNPFAAEVRERFFALADQATAAARLTSSANILQFENGRVLADSSDGIGLMSGLKEQAPDLDVAGRPVVMLGVKNRIELWEPARWATVTELVAQDSRFAEQLGELGL